MKRRMEKVFASPSRYVQGKGVLSTGTSYIKALGKRALLLSDDIVYGIAGKNLRENLEKIEMYVKYVPFNGEASTAEIQRVSQIGRDAQVDLVIGLGGVKRLMPLKRSVIDWPSLLQFYQQLLPQMHPLLHFRLFIQMKEYLKNTFSTKES